MLFEDKYFIAKKIKKERMNAKLTQAQLAEMIGISAKQLSRIEIGDFIPSLPTFLMIVKVLNIDIREFNINISPTHQPLKDKFLKLISCMTDSELQLCYTMSETLIKNLNLVKK